MFGDVGTQIYHRYIVRLSKDGIVDGTFATKGYAELRNEDGLPLQILSIDSLVFSKNGDITCFGTAFEWLADPDGLFMLPCATRIHANGKIDKGFGDQGIMLWRLPDPNTSKPAISANRPTPKDKPNIKELRKSGILASTQSHTVQQNDKIVFLANRYNYDTKKTEASYLLRITEEGRPDIEFGKDGLILLSDPTLPDRGIVHAFGCKIDRENNFNIIAIQGADDYGQGVILRYTAAGNLDQRFNKTGVYHYNEHCQGRAITVVDDGSIFALYGIAGQEWDSYTAAIIKLKSDGEPDERFNDGKPVIVDQFKPHNYFAFGLNIDTAARIVINGMYDYADGTNDSFMSRLTPYGQFDQTFGTGGTAIYEGFTDFMTCLIQDDVNILIGTGLDSRGPSTIARFLG